MRIKLFSMILFISILFISCGDEPTTSLQGGTTHTNLNLKFDRTVSDYPSNFDLHLEVKPELSPPFKEVLEIRDRKTQRLLELPLGERCEVTSTVYENNVLLKAFTLIPALDTTTIKGFDVILYAVNEESEPADFTINLLHPDNGQSDVVQELVFDWELSGASVTILKYVLYLGEEEDPPIAVDDIWAQQYYMPAGTLKADRTYYWRVAAIDEGWNITYSSVHSFTAGFDQAMGELYPTDGFELYQRATARITRKVDDSYVMLIRSEETYQSTDFDFLRFDTDCQYDWRRFYDPNENRAVCDFVSTPDGGFIVTGTIYNESPQQVLLWKLDSSGLNEWSSQYGSELNDVGISIIRCDDGGFALLYDAGLPEDLIRPERSRLGMLKLDSEGNQEWNTVVEELDVDYGDSGDRILTQTSDGGFVAIGNTIDQSQHVQNLALVKFAPSGEIEWVKDYPEYRDPRGVSLSSAQDGSVLFCMGNWVDYNDFRIDTKNLDDDGTERWGYSFQAGATGRANCLIQTEDGNYVLTGATRNISHWEKDFLIFKFTSSGQVMWTKTAAIEEDECFYTVIEQPDNSLIFTGHRELVDNDNRLNRAVWVLKTDQDGNAVN